VKARRRTPPAGAPGRRGPGGGTGGIEAARGDRDRPLRRAYAVLALAALLLATGCGGCGSRPGPAPEPDPDFLAGRLPPGLDAGPPVDGGTLTVRIHVEPPHLGYLLEPDWWLARIANHNLTESLVRADPRDHPHYRIVPELAASWEESEDRRVFTFHLRPGVVWHDGRPFTARDVEFTFARLLDPEVRAASFRRAFGDLESCTAVDDHTVVLRWKRPYVWALRKLADVPIYPAHAFADVAGADFHRAPYFRAPIGTGPYAFESWRERDAIVLGRFAGHWGGAGHVDRIVYRIVEEPAAALQLALRGELDVDVNLSSEIYVQAAREPKLVARYHRVKEFHPTFSWIGWNLRRPPFADVEVRRALAMLIDREGLREGLFHGIPEPANCVFYHRGPNCDPETRAPAFDPAGARALLAGAGWEDRDGDGVREREGRPFSFSLLFPAGQPVNEQLLLAVQDEARRAGIDLRLEKLEWATFLSRLRARDFDACYLSFLGEVEDDPHGIWHSSQGEDGSNYVGYASAEADALVERIRGEFDAERRAALFRELNRRIVADQPMALLFHVPRRALVSRRLRGLYESPVESFPYRDLWFAPAGEE
jgi:peptide/nickel transport system substrate-binding protein